DGELRRRGALLHRQGGGQRSVEGVRVRREGRHAVVGGDEDLLRRDVEREEVRFLHPEHDERLELSLDDVFLTPGYFDGVSRTDVDLTPVDFPGSAHPVVSSNMNAVTGKRMAETMARYGGLGVLPQDMDLRTVERIVRAIKDADPRYDTALSVSPD